MVLNINLPKTATVKFVPTRHGNVAKSINVE
jgi:hypothetical protein